MGRFKLHSNYKPAGGQPQAIEALVAQLDAGKEDMVLLGVTGAGKTFTVANLVERIQRPTLVMAHNKTLAGQLYQEFKDLFPENAVEYFVSYYDYYQPEAYVPTTDTYIEKDSQINDEIDRMRHSATRSVLERRDVIVVASVSCIYGIGSPDYYRSLMITLRVGDRLDRDLFLRRLVDLQYQRNDLDFHRGTFRVRGEAIEVFRAHENDRAVRIGFYGDEIEELEEIDPLTGELKAVIDKAIIFPASHFVTPAAEMQRSMDAIRGELGERLAEYERENQILYLQRLEQRTKYDLELLELFGHCKGIENYSRHLDGRPAGTPPATLIDYFPDDFLCVVDESHATLPQIRGMYKGDQSRKKTLVDFGFRLPSALDNRPLNFDEWEERVGQVLYVSATPGDWEMERAGDLVELLIRPTGLIDPEVVIRPVTTQVDDLLGELRERIAAGERALVGTLTRRMAEDLTEYLGEVGIRARYLHADVDTLDRIELLQGLREGQFDVLVGINLLREGLDLPEVSLVAVLDADREGFLRGVRSLIQVSGRAARNVRGRVIFYADKMTRSINEAVAEMERRRAIQVAYNHEHGITPRSILKPLLPFERYVQKAKEEGRPVLGRTRTQLEAEIEDLAKKMYAAAERLEFETAAKLRDDVHALRQLLMARGSN
ncbi:MAG: excinuclease ABC subunit UvrB [Pseudomonadota bacterium]